MGDFEIFMDTIRRGNLNAVKNRFRHDYLEKEDNYKWRPIHVACNTGHLEIAKFLVQNKCIIECEDKDKQRPIHLACSSGHLEIAKFLVQNKCSIECKDKNGWRPIHYVSCNGYLDVVQFLCEANCELDCKTKKSEIPAELARSRGKKDCENYLNEILKSRLRNIFDCIRRNDVQTLNTMYSPTIFKMEELEAGLSILEVAVDSNANEIINYFLNKLVNDEERSTLENYMEYCCRPDAVHLFQECLFYRSICLHDAEQFHMLCKAKTINKQRRLIKQSFIEIAAQFGCNAFIDALLKKSIYNEEEWTKAKELAIVKGHVGISEAISDRKHLLRRRAENHFTWLHSAVCDNDPDMLTYILEQHLVNPDFNNEVVGSALALSHMMCYQKCIEVLQYFNVNVNTQNKYLQSPLHEAIDSGMTGHCSYLINRADDIDRPGFMDFTALQCAVIKGYEELCDELVKNRADCVRYVEIIQQTAIDKRVLPISKIENAITLCMKIHKTIYPCFLEKLHADMINFCDGDGNSLLHIAVKILQPDLCDTLIRFGSNVEAMNDKGNSPLFELFSAVDNKSDNIEKAINILNILVEFGVDVNTLSRSGRNVFQEASQWNSERLMVSLLSKQSRVTCVTETDFKLAFTNQWFEYATTLITLMTEEDLKSVITDEILNLAMPHCDYKLLMSLFMKSTKTVQQFVIEDLLYHFALQDEYDDFLNLLKIEIIKPKIFPNGQTLLTSLLKKQNLKYCWAIINCAANKRCIVWCNAINETPLQIAIETDLFDLMNPLILNCEDLFALQFNWHEPLIPLFQKLSISKNNDVDQKLLAAINAIIYRGGDIYKRTSGGTAIINYCTRFKERIETFQNNHMNQKRGDQKICSVCLDSEVNCAFKCGHTFCMDCGQQLFLCPMCNAEVTTRTRLYFN